MGFCADLIDTSDSKPRKRASRKKPDIITASGASGELMPASIEKVPELLPEWVIEYCDRNNIQDIRKTTPQVFHGLCLYIGGNYIKPSRILKDKTRKAGGACAATTCNRYDPQAVLYMFDIFERLCADCGKIPFQTDYAAFCGVSIMYVREYVQDLTSSGINLAKKTHDAEIDAIRRESSKNPVGQIAILNNELWNTGGQAASGEIGQTGQALPDKSVYSLIETAKIE